MAVGVAGADGHDGHPGAAGSQEARIVVGAAVVRHLEHVGPQVDSSPHQPLLGLRAEVPGQQHADAPDGHPGHHGQVVGLGAPRGDLGGRGQDLDRGRADPPPVPGDEDLAARTGPSNRPLEHLGAVVGRRQGPGRDDADVASPERAGQPTGVVGVQVGEQDQWQPVDAQPVEATVDGADVRPRVDEQPLPGSGGDHQGVALAHVAGHEHRTGRRPAPRHLAQRPADEHEADDERERQPAQPVPPPQRQTAAEHEDGEDDGSADAGRPAHGGVGDGGRGPGEEHQPPDRPPRQPGQAVGEQRGDGAEDRREQAEDGRRRDGRGREQVGRQGHQADHPREAGDQRGGRQAGGGAHRHGVGEQPGPAVGAQPARPPRCQQHDRAGGGHGEGEADVPGQPRVRHQQDHDRPAQRRHGCSGAARGQREERDGPHPGRPQHAGGRPGQQDEAQQREDGHGGLHAAVDRPAAERRQDPGEHDRHVRPGHGGQVRQTGAPEVLAERRIHAAGVPHHEPRQESCRGLLEHPGRGGGQARPDTAGGPLAPGRLADQLGRPARGHPCDDAVGRVARAEDGADAHDLPGEQAGPALRLGEDDHPVVERHAHPAPG